jgi:hypothetical protein
MKKENRTLAGPVCKFVGAGPTITFQRGTADSLSIAIWEDGQSAAASASQYADAIFSRNTKGRMPAMRGPQINGEFTNTNAWFQRRAISAANYGS